MEQPQIRYTKTSDGVSIAYYTIGNGPPLLNVEFPSTLLAAWKIQQQYYEFASNALTLVSYDARGFGLSQRDVSDFSIDGMVRDIEAVLDSLGINTVRILANGGWSAPVSVAFAARHPDRVSHIVFFWGFARVSDSMHEGTEALLSHPNADWRFVSESMMRAAQGWDDPNVSSELAALLRESISLDGFKTFEAQAAQWDVTDDLASVTASALVVNPKGHPIVGSEQAAELAVGLRDARVVLMEGTSSARRGEEFMAAALPFLLPEQAIATAALRSEQPASTAVILFTDIVDSTAITARIGNAAFRERAGQLEEALRAVIRDAGGSSVDGRTLGDGVLGVFTSAAQAIDAALHCESHAQHVGLQLHLGIHAGDVMREGAQVSGMAVNVAARISDLTAPNEILVSSTVRDLARASTGVVFEDRGEREMKGVGEAVRVYAVREAN